MNYLSLAQMKSLATFHLYELLQSIINAPTYGLMKARINNPTVQEYIRMANINTADKKICFLIKHKLTLVLLYIIKH